VKQGKLISIAGRIQSMKESEPERPFPIEMTYRSRETQATQSLQVSLVINCTGPSPDYRSSREPLIRDLKAQGLAVPHPLGLGIQTSPTGALIDSSGNASDRLFTLGPPRIGDLWETTAAAEIRVHAEELARHLAQNLESPR
jgi:uncharacterized NAD(P)/FAD-binding protein YdhS